MEKNITKKYTNGEVTVIWQPALCIHSARCWKGEEGLPEVFNPKEKPWIKPEGAETNRIIEQVKKCPSGALSFEMNQTLETNREETNPTTIEPLLNGPLIVHGSISIKDADGNLTRKDKVTAFCRCGASANKPFCDGQHNKIGFRG
jgi:uncharacterized Fe-S cluster protein YjdI